MKKFHACGTRVFSRSLCEIGTVTAIRRFPTLYTIMTVAGAVASDLPPDDLAPADNVVVLLPPLDPTKLDALFAAPFPANSSEA